MNFRLKLCGLVNSEGRCLNLGRDNLHQRPPNSSFPMIYANAHQHTPLANIRSVHGGFLHLVQRKWVYLT